MTSAQPKEAPELVVSMIPTDSCADLWPDVMVHFKEAVERSYGRWSLESLLTSLIMGNQQLWVIFDSAEEKVIAACTTEIIQYPMTKMLAVQFLGGTDMDSWVQQFLSTIERFASDVGCTAVEAVARFGFWPTMKKFGYKRQFALYEKQLEDTCHGEG